MIKSERKQNCSCPNSTGMFRMFRGNQWLREKSNTLTCSTICGLWLQGKVYQAESEEQAQVLFSESGSDFAADPNQLDEYFQLEFNDPLGQFSTSRLIAEININKKIIK